MVDISIFIGIIGVVVALYGAYVKQIGQNPEQGFKWLSGGIAIIVISLFL